MGSLIDIRDVYRIYMPGRNEVRALDGVSLKIEKGEFLAVVGHSGSGKSTLMNIIGCLDMPNKGEYYLDGDKVSSLADNKLAEIRNKKIGFIFQGFNLIPGLNAFENVQMPLLYRGVKKEIRKQLAREALIQVGLENRMKHRINELSGGQQQRVAIARAIAADPPIILADEPTGNLDSSSGREIMNILEELWRIGRTVIVITHDKTLAARTKRLINIHDGKIIEDRMNA